MFENTQSKSNSKYQKTQAQMKIAKDLKEAYNRASMNMSVNYSQKSTFVRRNSSFNGSPTKARINESFDSENEYAINSDSS